MTDAIEASLSERYDRIKAQFDRMIADRADAAEWVRFSATILEAMMAYQSTVIEKQKAVLEGLRANAPDPTLRALRGQARETLHYIDQLTALYHRVRQMLTPSSVKPI